jgi:hypothetical protein
MHCTANAPMQSTQQAVPNINPHQDQHRTRLAFNDRSSNTIQIFLDTPDHDHMQSKFFYNIWRIRRISRQNNLMFSTLHVPTKRQPNTETIQSISRPHAGTQGNSVAITTSYIHVRPYMITSSPFTGLYLPNSAHKTIDRKSHTGMFRRYNMSLSMRMKNYYLLKCPHK